MIFEKFQHKIKTAEELKAILDTSRGVKTSVMCHGVFDVVHPGHVRHLVYAKSKADILITSLTADQHINKGKYRPHVPQDLRAANLAAFEMVDYVIIDQNQAPLELISILQPSFFAKGYEYIADGMPTKTSEEESILHAYGGKFLFTPGDIVYSSSELINTAAPSLRYEKLSTVLESSGLNLEQLSDSLQNFNGVKVHIIGDTIVDGFTQTTMIGGQTKTPTMSVLYESTTNYVGGAAIVAQHLKAAGADVTLTTMLGEDSLKTLVLEKLTKSGVKVNAVVDNDRPTTHKNAIIAKGYRLLKLDTVDNSSINDDILKQFIHHIAETECDLLIFSDFRHGIFNRRTIPFLVDAIPKNCFTAADSQVASRWGNITEFKGFDLVTPNEREARFSLGDQDSGIRRIGSDIYDLAECKNLILKLGERGLLTCFSKDHDSLDSFIALDSFADNIKDAVGSGDALLAYSALALATGESAIIASILGSIAAACECELDGNIPISTQHIKKKLNQVKDCLDYSKHGAPTASSSTPLEKTLIEA